MSFQTIREWRALCGSLPSDRSYTIAEYISSSVTLPVVLLKHDVESKPNRALDMARIESENGLRATYYFQASILYSHPEIIRKIADFGHEIGYHFDVLDQFDGDYRKAETEFRKVVNDFESEGHVIKTVCPHGNPIKIRDGWNSNKDFFRNPETREMFPDIVDIVVCGAEIFGRNFVYITDAGYSWYLVGSIGDNDKCDAPDTKIQDLNLEIENNLQVCVISSHPHRWRKYLLYSVVQKVVFIFIRRFAKWLSKNRYLNKLMSKFYWLAKKI